MTKVRFTTNIDIYNERGKEVFPQKLTEVPRKGDLVSVTKKFHNYFRDLKLPAQLEVTRVTWDEEGAICDLWYNKTHKEIADLAGAKTL